MKLSLVALGFSYAIYFGCFYLTLPGLPPRIATHFDLTGQPNGWMDHGTYCEILTGFTVGIPAFLLTAAFLVRWFGQRSASSAHQPGTPLDGPHDTMRAVMSRYVVVFCALLVLFNCGMHLLVVAANTTSGPPHLNSGGIATVTGAFFAATLVWSVLLCWRCVQLANRRA